MILINMDLSFLETTLRWKSSVHLLTLCNYYQCGVILLYLFKGCTRKIWEGEGQGGKKKKRQNRQKSCRWPHLSQHSLPSYEPCHCRESVTSLPSFQQLQIQSFTEYVLFWRTSIKSTSAKCQRNQGKVSSEPTRSKVTQLLHNSAKSSTDCAQLPILCGCQKR